MATKPQAKEHPPVLDLRKMDPKDLVAVLNAVLGARRAARRAGKHVAIAFKPAPA